MPYQEEEFLQLAGLNHFLFCRRQWALIHLEEQWSENSRTAEGRLLHQRAHDPERRALRGGVLSVGDLRIHSARLGLSGACDVVEFYPDERGVPLAKTPGTWRPYPVEYKRGTAKADQSDLVQLCAQAICLEEMLCTDVPEGALYYGQTRHRLKVAFSPELRALVERTAEEMHQLYRRGTTPRVRPTKACNACSLKDLCLPRLLRGQTVAAYLRQEMEDSP